MASSTDNQQNTGWGYAPDIRYTSGTDGNDAKIAAARDQIKALLSNSLLSATTKAALQDASTNLSNITAGNDVGAILANVERLCSAASEEIERSFGQKEAIIARSNHDAILHDLSESVKWFSKITSHEYMHEHLKGYDANGDLDKKFAAQLERDGFKKDEGGNYHGTVIRDGITYKNICVYGKLSNAEAAAQRQTEEVNHNISAGRLKDAAQIVDQEVIQLTMSGADAIAVSDLQRVRNRFRQTAVRTQTAVEIREVSLEEVQNAIRGTKMHYEAVAQTIDALREQINISSPQAAHARKSHVSNKKSVVNLDLNNDGKVDDKDLTILAKSIDRDHDGKIENSEMDVFIKAQKAKGIDIDALASALKASGVTFDATKSTQENVVGALNAHLSPVQPAKAASPTPSH